MAIEHPLNANCALVLWYETSFQRNGSWQGKTGPDQGQLVRGPLGQLWTVVAVPVRCCSASRMRVTVTDVKVDSLLNYVKRFGHVGSCYTDLSSRAALVPTDFLTTWTFLTLTMLLWLWSLAALP